MEENININHTEEQVNSVNTSANQDAAEIKSINNGTPAAKNNKGLLIAALLVACAALIVGVVALCTKGTNVTETKVKAEKVVQAGNLKIAYINTDTIMAQYEYAVEMQKDLQAKQSQIENSLKNQYTQLQKEEQEYLKSGGMNMTRTQQEAKEKEFQKREQQLSQAMQQQPAQFQQEVAQQNEKLLNAVLAFVKDYNSKHDKYNIILSMSKYNGPALYIDEGMDITDEIVKGLNEEHRALKKDK